MLFCKYTFECISNSTVFCLKTKYTHSVDLGYQPLCKTPHPLNLQTVQVPPFYAMDPKKVKVFHPFIVKPFSHFKSN